MDRKRWIPLLLTLAVLLIGLGVQQVTYADSDSNIGKFEYDDNSLQPTKSTGIPEDDKDDDKNFLQKGWKFVKSKLKKVTTPVVDAVKETGEYVADKFKDSYKWAKDKAQDGMQAMNEWWMEQNGWTKSAIILGGGVLALAGAVAFTPLAAGAALVMGAGGGLSYGLYAATTDNISFFGGLAWMGLGMASGGIGLLARGTRFAAWGAKGASVAGTGLRMLGGFLGRTGMISGGISAGIAGGMHLYRHFVHGEPLNPMAMAKDMAVWGAAGTIAGPLARTATTMVRSRIVGYTVGGGVAGGSEYTLGNLFQGKVPNLKTAATVTVIAATLPFLAVGATKAIPMIKGTPTQVAQTTTQVADTAVSQAGKTTSNNVVDTGVAQGTSKPVISGDNHILINPVKDKVVAPNLKLDKAVAGDNLSINLKDTGPKNISSSTNVTIKEVNYGQHIVKQGRKKVLQPNIKYKTPEGYTYTTDHAGRIKSVEGTLTLGQGKRNTYAQRKVGGNDRLSTDDGGHLVASIFKGSGEIDNLVPMDANLNRGSFKSLENIWSKAVEAGDTVKLSIKPVYTNNSLRPSNFQVKYQISDDDPIKIMLKNQPGG
ncbi:DNA/RNA non-specific endonuclease [Bacillus sp. Marseille-Q3570]|uniref:DNA/RNA non-specific endonuclease n=1 Tax=Bacillus sp. Marseille-Q3570 TaxID=2963522 RepID=UPI0021B70D8D|nr:DNA/RNA non-specific endonuclease [Bacillus sp. Marseille-Q3570]